MLVDKKADVEAKADDGYTTLMIAYDSGHAEITKVLIRHGADYCSRVDNAEVRDIAGRLHAPATAAVLAGCGGALARDVCGIVAEYLFIRPPSKRKRSGGGSQGQKKPRR